MMGRVIDNMNYAGIPPHEQFKVDPDACAHMGHVDLCTICTPPPLNPVVVRFIESISDYSDNALMEQIESTRETKAELDAFDGADPDFIRTAEAILEACEAELEKRNQ